MPGTMDSGTSVGWFPVLESCPRCYGDSCLSPLTVDSDIYYSCRACQYFAGVDDSTDQYALAEIVSSCRRESREGDPDRKVRTRIAVCTECGNEDVELFEIAGVDQTTGSVYVNCLNCDNLVTINANAEGCDDNTIVDSMRNDGVDTGSYRCDVDDDVSLLWQDVDVGNDDYFTNTNSRVRFKTDIQPEDDSIVPEWKPRDVGNGIGTSPEATGCETSWKSGYFGAVPSAGGSNKIIESNVDRFSSQRKCDICLQRSSLTFRHACTTSRSRSSASPAALHGTEGNVVRRFCDIEESIYEGRKTPRGGQRSDRNAVDNDTYIGQDRISDLRLVTRGDHVAWQRWYSIWHHAIVVESLPDFGQLTVMHNSGSIKPLNGKLASVRLEIIDVNPDKGDLYRYDYSASGLHCFTPDVVVQRASCRLNETYNPFVFNCEHFARWCKTGRQSSEQVKKLINRVANAVAVNVFWEATTVGNEARDDCRKYKTGAISRNAFRQRLAKNGCETAGGVVGSMAGGAIGSLLIPIPFVGSLIGSTLGNLIARWCGDVIGKRLVTS